MITKKSMAFIAMISVGLMFVFASESGRKLVEIKNINYPPPVEKPGDGQGVKLDIDFGKMPLYFITNKGQMNEKAKFYAKATRYTLWLTRGGLVFDSIRQVEEGKQVTDKRRRMAGGRIHREWKFARDVSRLIFLNANKNPGMVSIDEANLRVNYFKGNNRSKWHCDVPTSQAVLYTNLYKSIDLKVYGLEKQIEYDWIVKPGGNPRHISIEYKNVKGTRISDEGNLFVETDFGELMHKKPVSYQEIDGERKNINVTFKKIAENTYGFKVGTYDRSRKLIIDPVVLAYSTYLGGGDIDNGHAIAVDGSGNAYVAGRTHGTDFPTLNQYHADQGDKDVFVIKLDTTKSGTASLIYSTYLGGGGYDSGWGIAVDGSGNAYVRGTTSSTDFPTLNQYHTHQGGNDIFVTRLDTTKSGTDSLIYSTYLGGGGDDEGHGIAVDSSGNAYVTGWTNSTNFPTLNQYQAYRGNNDVIVTRLDTSKSGTDSLIYSTYLGGSSMDDGYGITVDGNGNAYVTGRTGSVDFPTLNQYQVYQGSNDVFVTRLDTTKSGALSLIYSTCLGGASSDYGRAIALDGSGYAYVAGWTGSADFPTRNQYQGDQGDKDVFVTKLDTAKSGTASLIYSTYLGGDDVDYCYDIALDGNGNVYVTGETASSNFPTLNHYQAHQGSWDVFVTRLDTTQSGAPGLIYSTCLGGGSWEWGLGIAVDGSGNAYVAGTTNSTNFPTFNQYQADQGDEDGFVSKLSFVVNPPEVNTKAVSDICPTTASSGGNVTTHGGAAVTARGVCWSTSLNPTTADSLTTDGTGVGAFTSSITGLIPNTVYYVRAYATNSVGTAYGTQKAFVTGFVLVTISGTVTDGTNPVAGVAITFSHDGHTETTDAKGYYSYTVPYGTSTTVTASKPGYTFEPTEYSYINLVEAVPSADFTVPNYVSVNITTPQNNDTVSGTVIIDAEVSSKDTSAAYAYMQSVTQVEFYIDEVSVKKDTVSPYKLMWDTTLVPNGNHTIKAMAYHSSGITNQHEIIVNVNNSPDPPHIVLNRTRLNFSAEIGDLTSGSQTFLISNNGGCCLNWTASASETWIQTAPLNGTANASVSVSVDITGLAAGDYTGTVTITDANADNSPVAVNIFLTVNPAGEDLPLIGSIDSPIDGSTVSGSIPVTGWALDDTEIASVKIYRLPIWGQELELVNIGEAVFIEGARPDIEIQYPQYPRNYAAGWGYMMLTNLLPNEGNGNFTILAIATDSSGSEVVLGSKSIICINANAVKPFGTIDTPTQGGDATGLYFVNFGWALTPQPNTIPTDGSTIKVWVDGVPLTGNPVYNQYREDIAIALPGYNNSDGAVGYYFLDTTLYANGIHSISWSVTDDAGNTSGIGSRYFRVINAGNRMNGSASIPGYRDKSSIQNLPVSISPIHLKKGYKTGAADEQEKVTVYPDEAGIISMNIKENERIEIELGTRYLGYLMVDGQLRNLPVGSTIDMKKGVFYWQPGPGFIGEYRFVFVGKDPNGRMARRKINITIKPLYQAGSGIIGPLR